MNYMTRVHGNMKNLCVCILCLYSVWVCVCNRFLCTWLDAWSSDCSPMLFACDPVYNVCIVNEVRSYSSQTHWSGGFKGDKLSATHPQWWLQCNMAKITLDLNFGLSMHSLKSTLAWRKTSYWLMFEDSVYTANRQKYERAHVQEKWTFKTIQILTWQICWAKR